MVEKFNYGVHCPMSNICICDLLHILSGFKQYHKKCWINIRCKYYIQVQRLIYCFMLVVSWSVLCSYFPREWWRRKNPGTERLTGGLIHSSLRNSQSYYQQKDRYTVHVGNSRSYNLQEDRFTVYWVLGK